jgi:hypothetical protein
MPATTAVLVASRRPSSPSTPIVFRKLVIQPESSRIVCHESVLTR